MDKVVVIQGAGMDQRGKVQIEVFGPDTLDQINARIEADAAEAGFQVEIYQSNDEVETVTYLAGLDAGDYVAGIINPSGFTTTDGPLPEAIEKFGVPFYEVHASNPSVRGVHSTILAKCKGGVCGFGYAGYGVALRSIRSGSA